MPDPELLKHIAAKLQSIARDCFDLSAKEKLRRLAEELDPIESGSGLGANDRRDRHVG